MQLSPQSSPMTLVSSWLTLLRNSKGNIGSGGAEWEWGRKNTQFSANKSSYLRNGARCDQGYYDRLIGRCICTFDWCQNRWPRMTLNWCKFKFSRNLRYFAFYKNAIQNAGSTCILNCHVLTLLLARFLSSAICSGVWQMTADSCTISKFFLTGFLIFFLVIVSRDFDPATKLRCDL